MRAFDKYSAQNQGIGIGMNVTENDSFVFPAGHVFVTLEEDGKKTDLDLGKNFIVFEANDYTAAVEFFLPLVPSQTGKIVPVLNMDEWLKIMPK